VTIFPDADDPGRRRWGVTKAVLAFAEIRPCRSAMWLLASPAQRDGPAHVVEPYGLGRRLSSSFGGSSVVGAMLSGVR
jgi:hypothetical protein